MLLSSMDQQVAITSVTLSDNGIKLYTPDIKSLFVDYGALENLEIIVHKWRYRK